MQKSYLNKISESGLLCRYFSGLPKSALSECLGLFVLVLGLFRAYLYNLPLKIGPLGFLKRPKTYWGPFYLGIIGFSA